MYSWVTVPSPTVGSHMNATCFRKRTGSRYRYVLVSGVTTPGRTASSGT